VLFITSVKNFLYNLITEINHLLNRVRVLNISHLIPQSRSMFTDLPTLKTLKQWGVLPREVTSLSIRLTPAVNATPVNSYLISAKINVLLSCFPSQLTWSVYRTLVAEHLQSLLTRFVGVGLFYITYSGFIMYIDACLTDDEPIWEPIEWSLVQTWILFLFTFAWIAENLIVSRYGSYTGRDKRVWFAWYKTFWLMELYYIINFGAAVVLVIVPFYYETNYNISFLFSWWHWYTRVFFFKFISLFSIVLMLALALQMSVRWLFWKKSLALIIVINIFISYLLYTHFIMAFFGYFTDPVWYQKTRPIDYIQLSHEPSRWGWGPAKKDHFTYHNVKTVFWFKNDGPYASAFLLMHLYIFLSLFFLYMYWITLFRRVYSTCEVPLTLTTYCVSSLKQFFYLFLMMYVFIFLSYISHYLRYPLESMWSLNTPYWLTNLLHIVSEYYSMFL